MAAEWTQPRLGTFAFEDDEWTTTIAVPAFDAFAYDNGGGRRGGPRRYELRIHNPAADEPPTAAMIELVERVVANAESLVPKVTQALWDDFNGRGPHSGMWWHGDLDQLTEPLKDLDLPVPERPEDLLKLLRLTELSLGRSWRETQLPYVELSFSAAFEDEHGVGVLTDGDRVVGLGYSTDVQPFDRA